jgi:hypothetical protein
VRDHFLDSSLRAIAELPELSQGTETRLVAVSTHLTAWHGEGAVPATLTTGRIP